MLKISEMATLASTTRRTLIFYDEQGVFSPARKNDAGYRFYNYNQLYELLTILALRNIGLSIEQIKAIQAGDERAEPVLRDAQAKIAQQIKQLERVQDVITRGLDNAKIADAPALYQPEIALLDAAMFWCSRKAVDCTEKEVAQLFAEFYRELDALALMDNSASGFLTDLPVTNPGGYMDASFRILKATDNSASENYMPLIEKPAGRYVRVWAENTAAGIDRGLKALQAYCQDHKLRTEEKLWQLNSSDALVDNGATKYGWLEYGLSD
jgi:DNA-binding transcriptional MerR regulator